MMKKIIVFVFLVMAVMIVAGCQGGETLAGQATKSQMSECKANKNCNTLFGACAKEKQCSQQRVACWTACTTEFGSGNAVKNCKSTKCDPPYLTCLDGCYDTAIAAWKSGQTGPVSSKGSNFGDINLDGKVNTQDLQCYVLFVQSSAATCKSASLSNSTLDLNCDGKIDAMDQNAVAKLMVGDSSTVDGNKNGVLDCKEVPTCTPGPTGKIFCKNVIDSAGNQFYAIKELQNAKCEKWYPQYFEKEYSTVCGLTADSCVEGKGCVLVAPTVCPTPDTICSQKFEAGASKGWYAFTRKMDSNCNTIDWTPFTAGNSSCGVTADSCVSGKGCVVVAPAQLATCTDSDNSWVKPYTPIFNKSMYVSGNVLVNGKDILPDECFGNTVREGYCGSSDGSGASFNQSVLFDCSKDSTTCQNGACVNLTASGSGSGGSGGY